MSRLFRQAILGCRPRHIRTLRQVLFQQPVRVLIGTLLPRAMRGSTLNRCTSILSDLGMLHHLSALTINYR